MRRILFPRSPRPHRKRRSVSCGLAVKASWFSLPLSAMDLNKNPMADRLHRWKRPGHFASWTAEVTAVTAFSLGEPTILCSHMDESIIVGYCTSAEVLPRNPRPSQIPSERRILHGKK